jgi:hypothetical protein
MERLKSIGGIGPVIEKAEQYPRLSAWIVLTVGMIIILMFEARDVGLELPQWIALFVATAVVAGLCVWIISWEDEEVEEEQDALVPQSETAIQPADEAPAQPEELIEEANEDSNSA